MTVGITTAHNEARLTGTRDFLDTGAGYARVRVYDGTRAATVNDAPSGNLLVEIALTKPCGTVGSGQLPLTQSGDGTVATTGTATWARVVNGAGATAFDCDMGVGAGELQLANATLYAGGSTRIVSLYLT